MSDGMNNIERDLGPEWPKRLYPHGGGREWSTSHHDDAWKVQEAFEVVPASQHRGAVDLRNAADKFLVAWDRRDGSHFSMIAMASAVRSLRAAVRGQ